MKWNPKLDHSSCEHLPDDAEEAACELGTALEELDSIFCTASAAAKVITASSNRLALEASAGLPAGLSARLREAHLLAGTPVAITNARELQRQLQIARSAWGRLNEQTPLAPPEVLAQSDIVVNELRELRRLPVSMARLRLARLILAGGTQ
ncbi:MAG: hypothetical protein ACXW5U_20025 [Thermoanaerobaculia bacterium]